MSIDLKNLSTSDLTQLIEDARAQLVEAGKDERKAKVKALKDSGKLQALKDEFDQLYEERAKRRRMIVISLHDCISGHANRVRVLDRFLTYANSAT